MACGQVIVCAKALRVQASSFFSTTRPFSTGETLVLYKLVRAVGLLNRRPLRPQLSHSRTVGASCGDLQSQESGGSGDLPEPSKRIPVHSAPSLIATRLHALSDAFH